MGDYLNFVLFVLCGQIDLILSVVARRRSLWDSGWLSIKSAIQINIEYLESHFSF